MRSKQRREPPLPGTVGRLKVGYDIAVLGRHNDFSRAATWETPQGRLVTTDPSEAFDALVGGSSLDSVLSTIAGVSRSRMTDPSAWDRKLTSKGVHPGFASWYLQREVATQSILRRQLPDQAKGRFKGQWLLTACEAVMDMGAHRDSGEPRDEHEPWALALRMLQVQYHDQLEHGFYLQELALALATKDALKRRGIDLDSAYLREIGLSFSDLAALSFAALATIIGEGSSGILDPATWINSKVFRVGDDQVRAFFKASAATYDQLQMVQRETRFHQSPLITYPLVRRSDGLVIAPIARDIMERPTRGFPTEAVSYLSLEQKGAFWQLSGDVYERYVKDALKAALGDAKVHKPSTLIRTDGKICDAVVTESPVTTLCEVKGVRFRPTFDASKRPEALRAELTRSRGVGHGLAQINDSALAIRSGNSSLAKGSLLAGLLIVRGEQVDLNSPMVRAILEDWVKSATGHAVIVKYQIANDLAFERLVHAAASGLNVGEYIQAKDKSRSRRHGEIFADLRQFGPSLKGHPLQKQRDEAFANLLAPYTDRVA